VPAPCSAGVRRWQPSCVIPHCLRWPPWSRIGHERVTTGPNQASPREVQTTVKCPLVRTNAHWASQAGIAFARFESQGGARGLCSFGALRRRPTACGETGSGATAAGTLNRHDGRPKPRDCNMQRIDTTCCVACRRRTGAGTSGDRIGRLVVSADRPTVRVRCRACGCALAVVRAEYSPDHHPGLRADTSGPVVRWNVRSEPTAAQLPRRRNHLDAVSLERRQESGPVAWPLHRLGATMKVWCDRHGFVSVSTAGLRAQHDEAVRSGRQIVWRVPPVKRTQ
jgi:hypothetical protein